MGKSGPNATFNLFFPGLGWPWIGEFVGFTIMFICFPTEQNLVNRKSQTPLRLNTSFGREVGGVTPLGSAGWLGPRSAGRFPRTIYVGL